MKLSKLTLATAFAIASMSASAVTLNGLSGAKTWHLSGLTAENTFTQEQIDDGAGFGSSNGWETTWAVGTIDQIFKTPINGSNTWNAGEGGDYLNYMIYGIADGGFIATGTGFDLFNTGATKDTGSDGKIHIDIYRSSASIDLNNVQTTSRCGFDCFTGLTDTGTLYLGLTMEAEYFSGDTVTTLFQAVSALQLPTTGSGFFFANAQTGSALAKWDSNSVDNVKTAYFDGFDFGGAYDLRTIVDAQGRGLLNSGNDYQSTGFAGYISDPISSRALPEPGSMALVGLGLLGFAGLRRRKNT